MRALGAKPVLDALASCLGRVNPPPDQGGTPTLFFFKTVADPFGKIARPLRPKGKALEPVEQLLAGEIGAATKLIHVATGDTLGPRGTAASPKCEFPPTSYTMAIRPKSKGDEEKINVGLHHLLEEDPTLRIEWEPGTHETLLHGLGDVHLEVTLEKLRRKYQIEAVLAVPHVPYQEAVRGSARQQHKYKKQSGGAGLYGDCTLEIEPLPRGGGFVWEDKIFGGSIPQQFRPSVEKGVRQVLEQGAISGNPIVDVRVRLVDGSTHPVDGKDIAFQLAGAMAMRQAVEKAGAYLLEPVMEVVVIVPAVHMGDVIGHLNARRGHIGGMTPMGGELEQVTAKVPLVEMYQFPIELRAATQGRGRYTMSFDHYEEVPAQVAQPIIAARQQQLHTREAASA